MSMFDTIADAHLHAFSHLGPPQSQKVGTHVDEDGQEHDIWQHVFIPTSLEDIPLQGYHTINPFKTRSVEEWNALLDQVKQQAEQLAEQYFPMSGKMHFRFQPLSKQARRLERWKKIRRRQTTRTTA